MAFHLEYYHKSVNDSLFGLLHVIRPDVWGHMINSFQVKMEPYFLTEEETDYIKVKKTTVLKNKQQGNADF